MSSLKTILNGYGLTHYDKYFIEWIPVEDERKPEDFEEVLGTVDGFNEVVLIGKWSEGWFLINDFKQKFYGSKGAIQVIAWMYKPPVYEK